MAKGAAKEQQLGGLHAQLARVFSKVLDKYETSLSALDNMPKDELENEMVEQLMEMGEPSPAMLSAIAKFLKDNEIGLDSEEVETLNATQRRLQDRREARKKAGINLSVVPHVDEA